MTSRWSSPIPLIRCSPVSCLISTCSVGSDFDSSLSAAMSLTVSFSSFASTAFVTTGLE